MEATQHFFSFSPAIGLVGFIFALMTYAWVVKQPAGNAKMTHIATLIENGSMTFLKKEYMILIGFLFAIAALLGFKLGQNSAVCYLAGAFMSMLCGFIGMKAATKANVRTAEAAAQNGQGKALSVAFFGGSVMGMAVASLGLLGIALAYKFLTNGSVIESLNGFAMGASSIALFARVGGGIYTKAADVGADLVGDRHDRTRRARVEPGRHHVGRLAQRGRPVDGPAPGPGTPPACATRPGCPHRRRTARRWASRPGAPDH